MAITRDALISDLPPVIVETLTALKTLSKLESALDTYLALAPADQNQGALERAVKPILLDAGHGRKSTVETIEKWNQRIEASKTTASSAGIDTAEREGEPEVVQSQAAEQGVQPVQGNATKKTEAVAKVKKTTAAKVESDTKQPGSSSKHKAAKQNKSIDADIAELGDSLAGAQITATSQETRFSIDAIENTSQELDRLKKCCSRTRNWTATSPPRPRS